MKIPSIAAKVRLVLTTFFANKSPVGTATIRLDINQNNSVLETFCHNLHCAYSKYTAHQFPATTNELVTSEAA
jgi:hypothetical protein